MADDTAAAPPDAAPDASPASRPSRAAASAATAAIAASTGEWAAAAAADDSDDGAGAGAGAGAGGSHRRGTGSRATRGLATTVRKCTHCGQDVTRAVTTAFVPVYDDESAAAAAAAAASASAAGGGDAAPAADNCITEDVVLCWDPTVQPGAADRAYAVKHAAALDALASYRAMVMGGDDEADARPQFAVSALLPHGSPSTESLLVPRGSTGAVSYTPLTLPTNREV